MVDFTSDGAAWYDAVELTKFVAGDNAITEIDERLGEEFGALTQIDVKKKTNDIFLDCFFNMIYIVP